VHIGVVGGTGDAGFGLALRFARAGHEVTIGSRSEERGRQAGERAAGLVGPDARVDGDANERVVGAVEVVFVTVPYEGHADTYRGLKDHFPAGQIVVDCTSPLATAVGGRPWQVIRPWHGSAAEQAEALLGKGKVRLLSGFQTISGELLQNLDRDVEGDVLLCGADAEAKATVGSLVEDIPKLRRVDAGDLSTARIMEPLTALMVSVNRKYGLHETGIALTGRETWGAPPPRPNRRSLGGQGSA
jgi:8-hydroxy-5-deazaflavin:NADPH oxidoreductase